MKYKIEIDKTDLQNLKKKVRDLRALDARGLSGALKSGANTAVNIAKRKSPVDTGNLRNNIGYERTVDGKSVEVFSNAPYSGFVEFGTRYQNAQPYFMPAIRLAFAQIIRELDLLIKKAIS